MKLFIVKYITILLTLIGFNQLVHGQSGNIVNGSQSFCAEYTLYDDGGPTGDFSQNDYVMLICTTDGSPITFDVSFLQEGSADVTIYEGNTTSFTAEIWDDWDGTGVFTATTDCITIEFEGPFSSSGIDEGFVITFYSACSCGDGVENGLETGVDCGGPHCAPCGTSDNISWDSYIFCDDFTVYDDGGPSGNYSLDTYEMTICSQDGSNITFTVFQEQLEVGTDFIIYEGTSASGTVLYNDNFDAPGTYPTTTSCVTILFDPPISGTDAGFMVTFSSSCSGPVLCNDGILNGYELEIDCGGNDCLACNCTNLNFETGDYEGWQMILGHHDGTVPYDFSNPIPHSTYLTTTGHCLADGLGVPDATSYINSGTEEFFIHNMGTDTTCMGEDFDDAGTYVAVLGNGQPGSHAKKIIQEFNVPPGALYIEVEYSVLLEDPEHPIEDQPYFQIRVFDDNDNTLPCADYQVIANQNLSGWIALDSTALGVRLWGLPWTKKLVPVASYVGQDLTVELTVSDCAQGAHYGQALVDASCNLVGQIEVLNQSGPSYCAPADLLAPSGYEYTWSTGETDQQIGVDLEGTVEVELLSPGDPPECSVTLDVVLDACPLAVTLTDWRVTCNKYPLLEWETSFESNVDYFLVESSCDGVNFHVIGMVNPNTLGKYRYEDRTQNECMGWSRYYRLSEVDLNANIERFNVLEVTCGEEIPTYTINNNEIVVLLKGSFDVDLISADGKIAASVRRVQDEAIIYTDDLAEGIYFLQIVNDKKFIDRIFIGD